MSRVFNKRNFKITAGLVAFYASTESYLHFKTQSLIQSRKSELAKAASQENDLIDTSRFKSATIAGMFINPFEEYRPQTGFEFMLVRVLELVESFYGNKIELHNQMDHHPVEEYLKAHKPDLETLRENSKILQHCIDTNNFKHIYKEGWMSSQPSLGNLLLFTWLGQSCSLIQVSGINILTDPILSKHLIAPRIGPKRLNDSPMSFEDIQYATNNRLDLILVSHDHPDHLENDLISKFGNKSTWIVPLGLKKTLARKGVYNVIEMDWWDLVKLNLHLGGIKNSNLKDEYELVCVPSMHWSGRYILDANLSLWCSYILRKNGKSIVYHAGDTGYLEELFEVIGKKYGPINFSLLPIGQYCPSWHQKPRHISPAECLKICSQTKSRYMMGVHWGTFKLSSEPILEPKLLLERLAKQIDKHPEYKAPEFGATYLYDLNREIECKVH